LLLCFLAIVGYTFFSVVKSNIDHISDGDTFTIERDGIKVKIRVAEVDCPEKNQPFGKRAKQFAFDLCFGRIARVSNEGKMDRYKRLIAEVYVDNICVNKELIKSGLAWHFKKYSDSQEYVLKIFLKKYKEHYPSYTV